MTNAYGCSKTLLVKLNQSSAEHLVMRYRKLKPKLAKLKRKQSFEKETTRICFFNKLTLKFINYNNHTSL